MDAVIDDLEPYPRSLARAVLDVFEVWLTGRATELAASAGVERGSINEAGLVAAAHRAWQQLSLDLVGLLATDVDEQRKNPLQVIREAALVMNDVLRTVGARPAVRDEFEVRAMPDDVFGIGPLAWRDLGDAVHEAGIEWGAWKAATVISRRRAEGKIE